MAIITSQATGNFDDGATWVGGVAPNPLVDDIVISAGHVVTLAAASMLTRHVLVNGTFILAANLTFGNGAGADAKLTLGPSSVLTINAGAKILQRNGEFLSTSTSASWAEINGAGSIEYEHIGFVKFLWKQSYVKILLTGKIKPTAYKDVGSCGFGIDITNCVWEGCGEWAITVGSPIINFKIDYCDFRNFTSTMKIEGSNEGNAGVTRSFRYNTCADPTVNTIQTLLGNLDCTGSVFWKRLFIGASNRRLFLDKTFSGTDVTATGLAYLPPESRYNDSYFYQPSGNNAHPINFSLGTGSLTTVLEKAVFEVATNEPNLLIPVSQDGTAIAIVRNNLSIKAGALFTNLHARTQGLFDIYHNTQFSDPASITDHIYLTETNIGWTPTKIRSNILSHKTSPGTGFSGSGVCSAPSGQVIAEVGYNCWHNVDTPYDPSVTITTNLGNDKAVDPQFVDPTRDFISWSVENGADGTLAGGLALLLGMNGYDAATKTQIPANATGLEPVDLVEWVRAGYRPTNAALLNAGHDGVTIGAMEYVSADDTAPVLTSPTATATSPTTATASVSTDDGNGTLYFIASTNATESAATVKAALSQSVTTAGAQSISISALNPETTYYVHFVQINGAGLESASVVTTSAITTPAIVYPEISATTAASTTSAVSATVTTDTAGGTIYGVLSESATEMEAADIKSGADDTATVTDAGDYTLNETGLATWTQYYWHIVHEDADGLMSNVLTIPVRTLDISIPLTFSDTAPATLLGVQVWSKVPKKADVEGLY